MTHWPRRAFLALAAPFLPALSFAATTAHHSHASLEVTRRASADSCPSQKEVREQVTAILGYRPFDKNSRRRLTAVLWAAGGTFHARIQLKDARTHKSLGVRELSANGPSCEELGAAMALAIALAIDPLAQPPPPRVVPAVPAVPPAESSASGAATVREGGAGVALAGAAASSPGATATAVPTPPRPRPQPPARSAPVATPPAVSLDAGVPALEPLAEVDAGIPNAATPDAGAPEAATPDAGAPTVATPAPEPPPPLPPPPVASAAPEATAASPSEAARPWHGIVGVDGAWTVGFVKRNAFGVFLHGGVAWQFFSVELEAGWLPSTSFPFSSGSISSTLVTGALVGCGTLSGFGLCAVVQTGPLTSTGSGYPTVQSASSWVLQLGVRAQWDWVFAHPVGLRLQAEGLVNAVQTRIQVAAEPAPETAWTSPTLAFSLAAGLFVLF